MIVLPFPLVCYLLISSSFSTPLTIQFFLHFPFPLPLSVSLSIPPSIFLLLPLPPGSTMPQTYRFLRRPMRILTQEAGIDTSIFADLSFLSYLKCLPTCSSHPLRQLCTSYINTCTYTYMYMYIISHALNQFCQLHVHEHTCTQTTSVSNQPDISFWTRYASKYACIVSQLHTFNFSMHQHVAMFRRLHSSLNV